MHRLVGSVATGGPGQQRLDSEPGEEGGAAVADQIKQQRGLGDQEGEAEGRDLRIIFGPPLPRGFILLLCSILFYMYNF